MLKKAYIKNKNSKNCSKNSIFLAQQSSSSLPYSASLWAYSSSCWLARVFSLQCLAFCRHIPSEKEEKNIKNFFSYFLCLAALSLCVCVSVKKIGDGTEEDAYICQVGHKSRSHVLLSLVLVVTIVDLIVQLKNSFVLSFNASFLLKYTSKNTFLVSWVAAPL